jgi:hypothetical protein
MNKKLMFAVSVGISAILLAGCAGGVQVKKPEIDSVKKVAVVSVTANREISKVDAKKDSGNTSLLSALGGALVKAVLPEEIAEQTQIVTHGDQKLGELFAGLSGWSLVPESVVLGNADYQVVTSADGKAQDSLSKGLAAIATADWVVPAGQQVIPLDSVIPTSNSYVNGERAEAPTLRKLGNLCAKLGADAIVVAEYKLSYKTTFLSGASGTGLFASVRGKAKPIVEVNLAVVNRDGKVVLKSARGWASFEGKEIPMMYKGEVDLKDPKGESVIGYNATVDAAVQALRGKIADLLK